MRKLLSLLFIVALVAVAYSIFSDPQKREKVLGTIEGSTGVDLNDAQEKVLEDAGKAMENAGKAIGEAAEDALKDLGETLKDPEFQRSLEKWGKDALDKLDDADLNRLKRDLELEGGGIGADYDAVLEKYLGEAVSS